MQQIAGGTIDKLEHVFEERVARALSRMGFYTQKDIAHLTERIDALSEAVNKLLLATRHEFRAGTASSKAPPRKSAKTVTPAKRAKPAGTATPAAASVKPIKRAKKRA